MSRVHCLECSTQVVLDPRGVCPEGHHVGAAGARIEQAMGHELAHPEEPEPWVYRIEPNELTLVGASASGHTSGGPSSNGTGPRQARPVRVPSFDDGDDDAEGLLRELHSLAAFDDLQVDSSPRPRHADGGGKAAADREEVRSDAPQEPRDPAEAVDSRPTATARSARPDPDAIAEAFAELSALDAPAQAMTPRPSANGRAQSAGGGQGGAPGGGPSAGGGGDDHLDHDDLASLFGTPPASEEEPAAPVGSTEDADEPQLEGLSQLPDLPSVADLEDAPDLPDTPDLPDRPDAGAQAPLPATVEAPHAASDGRPQPPVPPRPAVPSTPAPTEQPAAQQPLELDAAALAFELNFEEQVAPDAARAAAVRPATSRPDPAPPAAADRADATPRYAPTEDADAADAGQEPRSRQGPDTGHAPDPAYAPDPGQAPDAGQAPAAGAPRAAAPDLSSFTAKGGGSGRSGKRRLFGR